MASLSHLLYCDTRPAANAPSKGTTLQRLPVARSPTPSVRNPAQVDGARRLMTASQTQLVCVVLEGRSAAPSATPNKYVTPRQQHALPQQRTRRDRSSRPLPPLAPPPRSIGVAPLPSSLPSSPATATSPSISKPSSASPSAAVSGLRSHVLKAAASSLSPVARGTRGTGCGRTSRSQWLSTPMMSREDITHRAR